MLIKIDTQKLIEKNNKKNRHFTTKNTKLNQTNYTGNSNMSPGCFDFVLFESQLPAGELIQNFENDITLSVFIHIQKSN